MAKTVVQMGPGLLLGLTARLGWVARTRGDPIEVDDTLGAINDSSIVAVFCLSWGAKADGIFLVLEFNGCNKFQ
jgi:hypothetical protein